MNSAQAHTAVPHPTYVRRPVVRSQDRLSLTLFIAAAVHSILILGVSFEMPDFELNPPTLPTLEITLVHHRSDETPDKADFLAQASQLGGGDAQQKTRPQSPVSAPSLVPKAGDAQAAAPAAPKPVQATDKPALTADHARISLPDDERPVPETPPTPVSAAQLMNQTREMASLSTEISREYQFDAQRPRQKYISAQTRESKYAAYMEAWRAKVERIGNLNFPDEAKRQNMTGSLILDVTLNANGTIKNIEILRPSGHAVLDRAAMRIVRLAGPYAPFPPAIKEETDLLHIVRTWQFLSGNRLSTSP